MSAFDWIIPTLLYIVTSIQIGNFSLLLLDKTSCTCSVSLSTCDYWLTTSWVLSDSHELLSTNHSDWCLCCCTTDHFNARQNMSDNPSICTLSYVAWYKNEISVFTSCSNLFIDPLCLSFRLYSDYLYFGIANKSAEDFHEKVSESLQLFEGCLTEYTMRSCVYNTTVNNAMPVSVPLRRAFVSNSPADQRTLATSKLTGGKTERGKEWERTDGVKSTLH